MSFRLKCVAELTLELGRYDAIVEFTELAVRDFLKCANASGNISSFLRQKSIEHRVSINSVEQSILKTRIANSYIVSVYQYSELFLFKFRDEYRNLYGVSMELGDSTHNLLLKILSKLPSGERVSMETVGIHNCLLFDYYRLVRNKYVHAYKVDGQKVKRALEAAMECADAIKNEFPNLSAPNSHQSLSFGDFILFTRVVRNIARGLCVLVEPQADDAFLNLLGSIKQFGSIKQNQQRYRNAFIGFLTNEYGLENPRASSIVDSFLSH